jgi:fructose-1,6-bisphosphatase/inositol monophosphatase family enzyme
MTTPRPTVSVSDQAKIVDLVRRTAKSQIMPRFQNLSASEIATKSRADDLVTDADLASEDMLSRGLREIFPDAMVVGEEAVAKDASLRTRMADHDFACVIDPIDGTWNYAKGIPLFGVILSILCRGTPIFGMLYDPVMDDYVIADDGDGPSRFIRSSGEQRMLATSHVTHVDHMSGYIHFGIMPKPLQHTLAPVLPAFARTTVLRCSCHEYRIVAQGHADFALSTILNPWDHAAGALACQKAGGVSAFLDDGAPYSAQRQTGFLLTAASQAAWDAVAAVLRPVLS